MAARLGVVVIVVVLLVGCGADAANDEARPRPDLTSVYGVESGGLIDVGGRHVYVECAGAGSPTVVLEAGFGGDSGAWTGLLADLGRTTHTCAYDRAGLGASDAIPGVHDAGDELRDLERLLERGRIQPPYVLVGHSYGGLLARVFARAHAEQTGGVVLVDAVGIDWWRRGLVAWPRSFAPELRRAAADPVVAGVDLAAGAALDSRAPSLRDTRLVVVTAARDAGGPSPAVAAAPGPAGPIPPEFQRRAARLWRAEQMELAGLSSDHAHVVALRSGHLVHLDQPRVVADAVRAVVRAVRDDAELPPCRRMLTGGGVRCLS